MRFGLLVLMLVGACVTALGQPSNLSGGSRPITFNGRSLDPEQSRTLEMGYVPRLLQKGPDIGKGQGISEKLLADNFKTNEKNRWPDRRLSEKEWIGKDC
jgi:hypothetical protein